MSAAVSPSDAHAHARALALASALAPVRVTGGIRAAFKAVDGGATSIADLAERGGYRLKFPNARSPRSEAVIINTGGGVVGGDRVAFDMTLAPHTSVAVTTQAAERIYRSVAPASEIDIKLDVGTRARLAWLPQETILFSGARLKRRFEVDVATGGEALLAESMVFGRMASGEEMADGLLHDVWRVRRSGELVYADAARLDGNIGELLRRPAVGGGIRAMAVMLWIAPDAEARLGAVRLALAGARSKVAASAWNGLMAVRVLASALQELRADVVRVAEHLLGEPMPRVWST
jgi:urease accessory protein